MVEHTFSPEYDVSKISLEQYPRPPKRPIPRNPLSSPRFLVEWAMFRRMGITFSCGIPVALSSITIRRFSESIVMYISSSPGAIRPSATALST